MAIGYFVDDLEGYSFCDLDSLDPHDSLKKNLNNLKKILISLPKDIRLLGFRENAPFIGHPLSESILGYFQDELLDIGEIIKDKGFRVVSVIENLSYGFANENYDVFTYLKWLTLSHCEFYEMARLDYTNTIFIPYGDTYLCDYDKFKINLNKVPRYLKNRLGIFDAGNFQSMVIASHQGFPWLYNLDEAGEESPFFHKCQHTYKSLSMAPDARMLAISKNPTEIEGVDVLLSRYVKLKNKKTKKKSKKIKLRS